MTLAEKNQISHRKKAAEKLVLFLQNQANETAKA
jgi:inosine/xanthosine triphosphate pyrophosphatase family protein